MVYDNDYSFFFDIITLSVQLDFSSHLESAHGVKISTEIIGVQLPGANISHWQMFVY